jgi:hypothetical protein
MPTKEITNPANSEVKSWKENFADAEREIWDLEIKKAPLSNYRYKNTALPDVVEKYYPANEGNYRLRHSRVDVEDYFELTYYPTKTDQPISKLVYTAPARPTDTGTPTIRMQHDYGTHKEGALVSAQHHDSKTLEACREFVGRAFVDIPDFDENEILVPYNGSDESGEREIGRAAMNEAGSSIDFKGHEAFPERSVEHQRKRMQTALEKLHQRNAAKPRRSDNYRGSGELTNAAEIVQNYLRTTHDHEPRIPKEGLKHVPKKHLLLFIAKHDVNILNGHKPTMRRTVLAMADDKTTFDIPFHYFSSQAEDPTAATVSFSEENIGLNADFQLGLLGKQGQRPLEEILFIGPGESVPIKKNDGEGSLEYMVSNVDGKLFIDGKEISTKEKRSLLHRLNRLRTREPWNKSLVIKNKKS